MPSQRVHTKRSVLRGRKQTKEFIIWCDESDVRGKFCSNFYGGVLVRSENLKEVQVRLKTIFDKHRFFDEIKWQKVSEHYLQKYVAVMNVFFALIKENKTKVRIQQ